MSTVNFRLFGPLTAETDSGPVDLGPPKQRSVLAVLLLHANEIIPTDRIIDLVWGEDPPRTAEHSVQIYISDLRKALSNGSASNVIETRPPGYVLNTPPDTVDALQFERLIRDGTSAVRTGDTATGLPKLERAVSLWSASPLSDFAYEEFAQGYIRSLTEMRADALEALAGLHLDQGELDQTREYCRRVIESEPLREEPRRLMMLALYRSGRQADALREYGDFQRLLAEELGIEPSEALRDLEERVLLQDPTLADFTTTSGDGGNPYRGLRAFSEEDADVYFGREDLVSEVLDRLSDGAGFVSIIGPSGSGKSSAARAGVIPALRAGGETVVLFQPGARPLWELAGTLDRAGFGSRATILRRLETDPAALAALVDRSLAVVIDQFEELFTLAEPEEASLFGESIARAIRDPRSRLRVVATLRADYYDRPLSMPSLAAVFAESAVSVGPMSALGIERAIVEPARGAGRAVEPELLAQLISDMGDEPGALPLLQFTLFEMFERSSNGLNLEGYNDIGGLHGALTGGADQILGEMDDEAQDLVEQLFMRMVSRGDTQSTARPAAIREVLDLGGDRVALQGVLEAFGDRRLLTFGRDASGAAVVEIAHEYLISEWPQLGAWIEEHSEDLDRVMVLGAAAIEWVENFQSDDYLLRGDRLQGAEGWRSATTLRLTSGEEAYLDSSVELRDGEERAKVDRVERETALAKRARRRLWAFGGAVAALAAAVTILIVTLLPDPPPDVIVWWDGRGDGSFGDVIGAGVDAARESNPDLVIVEREEHSSRADEIEKQVSLGTPLVILEWAQFGFTQEMVVDNPETEFVFIDCTDDFYFWFDDENGGIPPNMSCIFSANAEMGFLAGAAAAMASDTGTVGFVGGADIQVIWQFQTGFEQGVAYLDSSVDIVSVYLSGWNEIRFDQSGFASPTMGEAAARHLHALGADVVFAPAGFSVWGAIDWAAKIGRDDGANVWSIGVDSDQWVEAPVFGENIGMDLEEIEFVQSRILTSVVKRLDVGIEAAISTFFETGEVNDLVLTVQNEGVGYTTSGGHLTPWTDRMDDALNAIMTGEVVVASDRETDIVYFLDELLP